MSPSLEAEAQQSWSPAVWEAVAVYCPTHNLNDFAKQMMFPCKLKKSRENKFVGHLLSLKYGAQYIDMWYHVSF